MTDIDKYVEQLKSPDKNKRYDACEELRVASDLPEKAVLALQETTNDPDPMVADAAQRALAVHTKIKEKIFVENQNQKESEFPMSTYLSSGVISLVVGTLGGTLFPVFSYLIYGLDVRINNFIWALFPSFFIGGLPSLILAIIILKNWKSSVFYKPLLIIPSLGIGFVGGFILATFFSGY